MNDVQDPAQGKRLFDAAPLMLSAPPSLHLALADRQYIFDGGPAWTVERALDLAAVAGVENQVGVARQALEAALAPAAPQWFGKRLPVFWTLFMAGRQADARALTVWMAETAYLLGDLPHDIVAHSIDRAIQTAQHGFMPSVGEIRKIADPLVSERSQHIERLAKMEAALADPIATADREQRRREQAAAAAQAGGTGHD